MGFNRKVVYFLVHRLRLSNEAVKSMLMQGQVFINQQPVYENCIIHPSDEIRVNETIIQAANPYVYIRFHKPVGWESSLNENVNNNISPFFKTTKGISGLAIAGRLDKASEGLLILSNNGKWIKRVCHPDSEKEKKYQVWTDKPLPEEFALNMAKGVPLWKYTTKPCKVEQLDANSFYIWLTEGKNRQIRNMCNYFSLEVTRLVRLQIDGVELGSLGVGEWDFILESEIKGLP